MVEVLAVLTVMRTGGTRIDDLGRAPENGRTKQLSTHVEDRVEAVDDRLLRVV